MSEATGDPGPSSEYYSRFASLPHSNIRAPSPPSSPLLASTSTAQEVLDAESEQSLYSILNLSSDASDAEIRDRYRSLATTYHPDRQRDPSARHAAHRQFTLIQRAYEVLTDPGRRTIYDLYGEEGLKTSWEVGPRNRTKAEMRDHYARQFYAKRQVEAEELVQSKGAMTVALDGRFALLPRRAWPPQWQDKLNHGVLARVQRVGISRVVMRHSFETGLNDKTQLIIQGTAITKDGAGGANVTGTIRHQYSPRLWGEVGCNLISPRVLTAKGTWTMDETRYLTGTIHQQTLLAPPRLSLSLGQTLAEATTGFLTFKTGFFSIGSWGDSLPAQLRNADRSALTVGVTQARRDGSGRTFEVTTGLATSHIAVDQSIVIAGVRLKGGLEYSLGGGLGFFVDAGRKITKHVRGGVVVQVGSGVVMRLRLSRLGQTIAIPIALSDTVSWPIIIGSTVLPTAAYAAWYRLYLMPRKQRDLTEHVKDLRSQHADYIAQKRAEAMEAVSLMERAAAQRVAVERERDGLIVVSAQYGLAEAFTPRGIRETRSTPRSSISPAEVEPDQTSGEEAEEMVIDVTTAVQSLVSDSMLVIPGGRGKHNILGFWDPCIGESKKLRIRYLFRSKLHQVTVDDRASVRAPMQGHLLSQ